MTAKMREQLTAIADEMREIQAKGADADYATVNAWLSVIEAAMDELKPKAIDWCAEGISVNQDHNAMAFPHCYLSVNLVSCDRETDAIINQEHLAEQIAALVTEHTTRKEKA